jgi:hypothetical protein
MNCPCCAGKPLSFAEFWSGVNAIRVQCRECGCELKANRVTWAWLLACISILALFFILLFANIETLILPEVDGKLLIFLFIFLCAVLSWFTGGYVPVEPNEGSDEGGTGKPVE